MNSVDRAQSKKEAIAREMLQRFPVFDSNCEYDSKFVSDLEQAGAGIFLGKPHALFDLKVIVHDKKTGQISEVGTGYFGEIMFKNKNFENWIFSGIIGFVDERGNFWCCSKLSEVVKNADEIFFPYCIETVFESKWFAKKSALISFDGSPAIVIEPPFFIRNLLFLFKTCVLKSTIKFATTLLKLQKIQRFFIVRRLPVCENSGDINRKELEKLLYEK